MLPILWGRIFVNRTMIFPHIIGEILTVIKTIIKKNLSYYYRELIFKDKLADLIMYENFSLKNKCK